MWAEIEAVVPRSELAEALVAVVELAGPPDSAADEAWRSELVKRLRQFYRCLRRRDIFAVNSSKWGDPRAKLLSGTSWTTAKPVVLYSLDLPPDPDDHLDERADLLDATFREVTAGLPDNTAVRFDDAGRCTWRRSRRRQSRRAWRTCGC